MPVEGLEDSRSCERTPVKQEPAERTAAMGDSRVGIPVREGGEEVNSPKRDEDEIPPVGQNPSRVQDVISGQMVPGTPEEIGAVQPFARQLVQDYNYPVAHIRTRPQ